MLYKIKGTIMLGIIILIFLAILWRQSPLKEGLLDGTAATALGEKITDSVNSNLASAGVDVSANLDGAFAKVMDFIDVQTASMAKYKEKADAALQQTTENDTTAPGPYDDQTFLAGKTYGKAMCAKYASSPDELNSKCKQLTAENCNLTDCCIFVEGKQCMAGNQFGPKINVVQGKDIDFTYYSYKNQCYGACGKGIPSANPCSDFKDNDTNISYACLARLWSQTGCPNAQFITNERVAELKDYSKLRVQQQFNSYKAEINFDKCYGEDENLWPAPLLNTTADSTNLSLRAVKHLYKDSGCPNNETITTNFVNDNRSRKRSAYIRMFADWKNTKNDGKPSSTDNLTKCYGPDETKWIDPCDGYADTDKNLNLKCIKKLYRNSGCEKKDDSFIDGDYNNTQIGTASYLKDTKASIVTLFGRLKNFINDGSDYSNKWLGRCYNDGNWPPSPPGEYILCICNWGRSSPELWIARITQNYVGTLKPVSASVVSATDLSKSNRDYFAKVIQLQDGTFLGIRWYDGDTQLCKRRSLLYNDPWINIGHPKVGSGILGVRSMAQLPDGRLAYIGSGDNQLYVSTRVYTFDTAADAMLNTKKIYSANQSVSVHVIYLKEHGHSDPNHRHPYLSGNRWGPDRLFIRRINTESDRESEFGPAWYDPIDPVTGNQFDQGGFRGHDGAVQLKDGTTFASSLYNAGLYGGYGFQGNWQYRGGRGVEINRMSVVRVYEKDVSVNNTIWKGVDSDDHNISGDDPINSQNCK